MLKLSKNRSNLFEYNGQTKDGFADIHLSIIRRDLSSVIKLAANECDLNVKTPSGNTALHIAVLDGSLEIIHALLALGADPNIVNDVGESPRHLAKTNVFMSSSILIALVICGAKRCTSLVADCTNGCINEKGLDYYFLSLPSFFDDINLEELEHKNFELSAQKDFNLPIYQKEIYDKVIKDLTEAGETSTKNFINILSLDGGGIRGLVILQILIETEKEMGEPIFPYFDWVAGTSTGGIIAAALAKGKSLRDCQKLYLRLKDAVFHGSIPYETKVLEKFLQDEMGQNTRLSDIPWPRLIIPTVKIDKKPAETVLMRNYQFSKEEDNLLLWKKFSHSVIISTRKEKFF